MHVLRARCSALVSAAVALLFGTIALSPAAYAQAPGAGAPSVSTGVQQGLAPSAAPKQSGVVGRIIVQGDERIDQDTIISYLPIAVGQTVDPVILDTAVKTLAKTDLFA